MYYIISFILSLARFFQGIETHIFLMLELCPATAFRMFPPLEQFPPGCEDSYIAMIYFTSLLALALSTTRLFVDPELVSDPGPEAGWLTRIFRRAARNSRGLSAFFSFIRLWLHVSSLHSPEFQLHQDSDLLLFLAKERILREYF